MGINKAVYIQIMDSGFSEKPIRLVTVD